MSESRSHFYSSYEAEIIEYEEAGMSSAKGRKISVLKRESNTLPLKQKSSGLVYKTSSEDAENDGKSTKSTKNDTARKNHDNHKEQVEQQAIPKPIPKTKSIFGNRMLSLSTSSLTSLIPGLYSLGSSYSMPSLQSGSQDDVVNSSSPEPGTSPSPEEKESDELARESDVTVSTNITSQAEYKGFASYVISGIFLIIWLSWSLLPDRVLNDIGIFYYPSRWWALAIPAWILILMIYTYVALALYNIERKTKPLDDLRTIVDTSGIVVTEVDEQAARNWWGDDAIRTIEEKEKEKEKEKDEDTSTGINSTRRRPAWKDRPKEKMRRDGLEYYVHNPTSGIWDLPITKVNDVLYSEQ